MSPQPAVVSQPVPFGSGVVGSNPTSPGSGPNVAGAESNSVDVWPGSTPNPASGPMAAAGDSTPTPDSTEESSENQPPAPMNTNSNSANAQNAAQNQATHLRRQNPQDVYDDLKLRDEILSGAYANAVMIGHGPYEFSFDFITNFYPQSAVSCRVYLASGHIYRLLESLRASWEQLRPRLSQGTPLPNPPPPNQPPPQPPR